MRGPFGVGWPVEEAEGFDVLLVAGGIGLAPLRPAIYRLLRHRAAYGRVGVLYGARTPDDHPLRSEARRMAADASTSSCASTVDHAGPDWTGDVGL